MTLAKSLLLGSAAGLMAVAGAHAADLPMKKAAPVEYVRVCSAYGAGFFYIPGGETCLKISGRVRAEYRYLEPEFRADSASGWRTRGQLNLDSRTATAYGTLRTFIRFESTFNSGSYSAANAENFDLNKAFIQFAGITAGITSSFFDFYANGLNWGGLPTGSDTYAVDPVVFAYTASFGSGFSATISLEDPNARQTTGGAASALAYAGDRMPDVVGNLRVDQAWGSAQLSGAVHQIMGLNRTPVGTYVDTDYGFAVQAGVQINMPFLAPGDQLWLQAAYATGAVSYLGLGSSYNQNSVRTTVSDADVDALGDVKKTAGDVLTAAFLHSWTPQIRQGVFGTYGRVDAPTAVAALPVAGVYASGSITDISWWQIGTNLTWTPVKGLDIGGEVVYRVVDPKGRIAVPAPFGAYSVAKDDAFEARLRIQRDF